jgi:hypothetical protein
MKNVMFAILLTSIENRRQSRSSILTGPSYIIIRNRVAFVPHAIVALVMTILIV